MSEATEVQPNTEALLDLAAPRVIVLNDRGKQFVLGCRRIEDNDWLNYFAGIVVTSEQTGKERITTIDTTSPRIALAEAVLDYAQGYKVSGGIELMSLPGWKKKIPLQHRIQLGEALAGARISEPSDELLIHAEGEVVELDATWSAVPVAEDLGENTRFAMQRFERLRHVLQSPSEEQHRRYANQSSKARVVGGSRSGKTIYSSANALLAKLYDELIVSVGGYAYDGHPLTQRATVVGQMDFSHKVMVAQELFQPQATAQLAGGDAE
jgi:hypothetical protein